VAVSLVQRILDAKLADQPTAVVVVVADLLAVVLALCFYFALTRSRRDLVTCPRPALMVCLFVCNIYFLAREASQAYHMHKLGLALLYWGDWWNTIDVLGVGGVFAVLGMISTGDRKTDAFRAVAACCSVTIWLKLLGTIKASAREFDATTPATMTNTRVDVCVPMPPSHGHIFVWLPPPTPTCPGAEHQASNVRVRFDNDHQRPEGVPVRHGGSGRNVRIYVPYPARRG